MSLVGMSSVYIFFDFLPPWREHTGALGWGLYYLLSNPIVHWGGQARAHHDTSSGIAHYAL